MDWITYIDTQIAKVILGSTLMQEPGERGSFALGAVHTKSVFGALAEFDSASMCDTLENSWVRFYCNLNNIPSYLAPKVEQAKGKDQQLTDMVDIMMILAERGFPVSVEQISEATGIRPAREGETLISMPLGGGEPSMQAGPGAPFNSGDQMGLPTISDTTGMKPSQVRMTADIDKKGNVGYSYLEIGLPGESSCLLSDVEKYEKTRQLFRRTTRRTVSSKLGPMKERQVRRYASDSFMIEFDYTNLQREKKHYLVEPYSYRYRRGFVYLYAFDPEDGRIKSFFVHKISNIRKNKRFRPKWSVEITEMAA
jgi:hypothetical protein